MVFKRLTIGAVLNSKQPPKPRKKFWIGTPPEKCDLCNCKITSTFIDGATTMGPWANMCPLCSNLYGTGLGTGKGQKYQIDADGKWPKVEG